MLILVGALTLGAPAQAGRPDLAEVQQRALESPVETLAELDRLLKRRDRAAAPALTALALARAAADDPAWRAAHPGWLQEASQALSGADAEDARIAALQLIAGSTLRQTVWAVFPTDGTVPPEDVQGLQAAAVTLADPFLLAYAAGLHHLREDGAAAALGYLEAARAAETSPPSADVVRGLEMAIGGLRVFTFALDGADRAGIAAVDKALRDAVETLAAVPGYADDAEVLQRRLLVVELALRVLEADALHQERATAWLDAHPDDVEVWLALGSLHERHGDLLAAEQCLLEVTERAPDLSIGHLTLGALYVNRASATRAQLDSDDPDDITNAAEHIRADLQRALPALERAHELDPADEAALMGLVTVAGGLGDLEAMQAWNQRLEALRR